MKCRITIVGRIKHQVEDDQARPRPEQTVEQQRPNFARPRERPLGHQLKRSVVRDFFRRHRRQLQGALINPEKNEIIGRRSFSALPPEQILKALFATPRYRDKRRGREEMAK